MPGTTSTQPTVIGLISKLIFGLGLTIGNNPVTVYLGSQGPVNDDNFVIIMGWPDGSSEPTDGTEQYAALGPQLSRDEHYDIGIIIVSYSGGDDSVGANPTDPGNAQATALSNAASLQASIEAALYNDVTLATAAGGIAPILFLTVSKVTTDFAMPGEGEMGRFCQITMRVHIYNRLQLV